MYHGFVHQTASEKRGNLLGLLVLAVTWIADWAFSFESWQSQLFFGGCLAVGFTAWLLLNRRDARLQRTQ